MTPNSTLKASLIKPKQFFHSLSSRLHALRHLIALVSQHQLLQHRNLIRDCDLMHRREVMKLLNAPRLRHHIKRVLRMMMLRQQALPRPRVDHQRVPIVPIRLRKRAINRDRLPALLHRVLVRLDVHRHVSVDDESVRRATELREDPVAEPRLVEQLEVRVLLLEPRVVVRDEVALDGGDALLGHEGGGGAHPEVPHEVEAVGCGGAEGGDDFAVAGLEEFLAGVVLAVDFEGDEVALFVDGDGAVEDEVVVPDDVGGAAVDHELHVLPQLLGLVEALLEGLDALLFLGRERVGVGGVDGGEVGVEEGVGLAVELARGVFDVKGMENHVLVELELGVAPDDLALELVLQDRRRLVHLRQQTFITMPLGILRQIPRRRIIAIHRRREPLQRRQRNPIPLLNLGQHIVPAAHP
mmetsp:Transcript_4367/g.10679  ORF Transcript_4367/g.10679 Transcript_4367/m.10679 type:complete len:411 (+) Transcript_4367:869-2101(+)